ncbi:MAG: response regulator, partial [Pseudomonadota bacterium]
MATILVVDDHVLNREFLITLLGYGGHRLRQAADGVAGLEMMRAEPPDLVIADILMPQMDGYEFVANIHNDPDIAHIPIMFYTAAYREHEANIMALACGVRWVLPKPSEPELIIRVVNEALGLDTAATALPSLMPPPPEGSQLSTIDGQMTEYLLELQMISQMMAQIVPSSGNQALDHEELFQMAPRLARALSN